MSDLSVIPARKRDRAGKGAARATRREGLVPCVIYGDKKDPQMISVDPRVIWKGLEGGHFWSTVYTIDVDGGKKEKALARDVQFHPVSDDVLHIDFIRVGKGQTFNVMVPVHFANEENCPGLKEGGVLSVVRHELELICSADNMPQEVSCDLSKYEMGDTIRISDVELPEGVESAITDRDPVVVTIAAPTVEVEPTEEEEGEEVAAEEAAAEEGEEGEEEEAADE